MKELNWPQQWGRNEIGVAVAVGLLAIAGAIGLSTGGDAPQTLQAQPMTADREAILTVGQSESGRVVADSLLLLDEYRADLLQADAARYQARAAAIERDKSAACFRQGLGCAFEALLQEARAELQRAQNTPDDAAARLAIDKVRALEIARQGTVPPSPEHALARQSIDNLISAYQQARLATAEAKAMEIQSAE